MRSPSQLVQLWRVGGHCRFHGVQREEVVGCPRETSQLAACAAAAGEGRAQGQRDGSQERRGQSTSAGGHGNGGNGHSNWSRNALKGDSTFSLRTQHQRLTAASKTDRSRLTSQKLGLRVERLSFLQGQSDRSG